MKSTRKADSRQGNKPRRKTLRIDQISLDGETQPRAELDQEVIAEYKARYLAGVDLPPVGVFTDGAEYWLADGFHRRWAAQEAGFEKITCIVHTGTLDDARWFSYAVNQTHGLRRSNEDKQKAVASALRHRKGKRLSDRKIAEHVGVSHPFVAKVRAAMESTGNASSETKREGRDGRVIETSRIGKAKPARGEQKRLAAIADRLELERLAPVEPNEDAAQHSPCPNCGNRTRNEDGDCARCKDPCENEVGVEQNDDDEPGDAPEFPPEADTLVESHAQPWDRWGDWRVAVANVTTCCKRVDPAVVAKALEKLAADIRSLAGGCRR